MGTHPIMHRRWWIPAHLVLVLVLVAFASTAGAAEDDELDMDYVKEIKDEGTVHFEQAANVDLSRSERNKHIKKGYALLTEAFEILDAWCDAHPKDADRLEDLIVEIHTMRYWLRKEAPMGVIGDDSNVRKGKPPDWPDKPPDDIDEPALPPGGGAAPAPARPAPAPASPPSQVDRIDEYMKSAANYARAHPYDLAGIRDLYLEILEFALPGTAPYVTALRRISEINQRLKEAYRLLRDEDPDSLKLSGSEERKLVHSLSKDLKNKEPDVRLRAAEYLGLLGSGDAARHLAPLLGKDKDERVREMALNSLEKIGGRKVTEELAKLRKRGKEEAQLGAMRVLTALAGRSAVEARYSSISLGEFAFSKFDSVADQALTQLEDLGPAGVLGLMNAITLKHQLRRLRIIRALGDAGDGRAGAVLGAFLIFGAKGRMRSWQEASKKALLKIGKPCVPHLARFVEHPRNGQWTREILRQITGRMFKTTAAVRSWWRRNS